MSGRSSLKREHRESRRLRHCGCGLPRDPARRFSLCRDDEPGYWHYVASDDEEEDEDGDDEGEPEEGLTIDAAPIEPPAARRRINTADLTIEDPVAQADAGFEAAIARIAAGPSDQH